MIILVMCILLQHIINPRDFVKYIDGKIGLWRKELNAQRLLLCGKIKKVLSRAHVCSLERRARNAHDQNDQTLRAICMVKVTAIRPMAPAKMEMHSTINDSKMLNSWTTE